MTRLLWLLLAIAAVAAGCGGGEEQVRVLAAASLTDVLREVDAGPQYGFGGSAELATQIREGAPASVFVSADPRLAHALEREGLASEVVDFGGNRLVIAVPSGNPASITGPADLAESGVRLVVAQEGVPVGDYARQSLRLLGLEDALSQVVSQERDTRGVLGKVALGEADAGIVYSTDVDAVGGDVRAVEVPTRAQPSIRYSVAILRDAPGSRAFVERLLGEPGRQALNEAGFGAR